MELVALNIQNMRILVGTGLCLGIGLTLGYLLVAFVGSMFTYFITPKNDPDVEAMFQEALKKKEEADNKEN